VIAGILMKRRKVISWTLYAETPRANSRKLYFAGAWASISNNSRLKTQPL
jgi:hypothetical protein